MNWAALPFTIISEFLGDLQSFSECSKQLFLYCKQKVLLCPENSFFVGFEDDFLTGKPLSYIITLLRAIMAIQKSNYIILPEECKQDKVFRSLSFRRIDSFHLPPKYDHLRDTVETALDALRPSLQQRSLCVRFIDSRKGYGLFATRLILRGQPLCVYLGEIVSKAEAQTRYATNDEKVIKTTYKLFADCRITSNFVSGS